MSDIKLKPCMRCGGKAKIKRTDGYNLMYYVQCSICRHPTLMYSTPEEAAEAWNRRMQDERD